MRPETGGGRPRGRLQLLLVAAVFLAPLAAALWLYYGGHALQPEGRTNHGALFDPVRSLADDHPGLRQLGEGRWLFIYMDSGPCRQSCLNALHTLRQSRLMLGNDMHRVQRVFLHGETTPDKVFLATEHEGLELLRDDALQRTLTAALHGDLSPGGYFIVDPLGNLVMYFPPDLRPRDMVDDIEHLLELSRIG
ncbi:MAG: hypothetical protein ACREQZ_16200 [Woeseiaceae bacterium]